MKVYLKSSLLFLFFGVLLVGCSQEPTSVGSSLTGAKFSAHETTIASIGDTSFTVATANGAGANVLIGKYSTVEAKALIQFTSTIPDSLTTCQVDTAELHLTVSYMWTMDTTTVGEYEIREVQKQWSGATVTADSFSVTDFAGQLVGTLKNTVSMGKELVAQLDTAFVHRWADTSKSQFHSIALVAKSGTVIWGFAPFGSSTPPFLRIKYHKDTHSDSLDLHLGEDTFLATRDPFQQSALIETQAGISVRSKINFDFKQISDSVSKAIVNNATMELTLKESILGVGMVDSVLALLGGSDAAPDSVAFSYYTYGSRKDKTQDTNNVYIFSVTPIVQLWINTPSNNHGIVLRSATDVSSVDKLEFYASGGVTLGPRILVTYTKK
jgi:hypothetical protein